MVDWNSLEEQTRDVEILWGITLAFLGISVWDFMVIFGSFEWPLLTGKMKFKWPMALYGLNRLAQFAGIALYISLMQVTTKVNCDALMKSIAAMTSLCGSLSSAIFMLRALALWRDNRVVCYVLLILQLGEIAVWFQTPAAVSAIWTGASCALGTVKREATMAAYVYTLLFYAAIAGLQVHKLLTSGGVLLRNRQQYGVTEVLFRDGVLYLAACMFLNLGCIIMFSLNLNPVMSYILLPPFLVTEVVMSCRAVINLNTYHLNAGYDLNTGDTIEPKTRSNPRALQTQTIDGENINVQLTDVTGGITAKRKHLRTSWEGEDSFRHGDSVIQLA